MSLKQGLHLIQAQLARPMQRSLADLCGHHRGFLPDVPYHQAGKQLHTAQTYSDRYKASVSKVQ